MVSAVIGFVELGGIILAWSIFWNFVIRAFTANHADSPAVQGLAAVYHA